MDRPVVRVYTVMFVIIRASLKCISCHITYSYLIYLSIHSSSKLLLFPPKLFAVILCVSKSQKQSGDPSVFHEMIFLNITLSLILMPAGFLLRGSQPQQNPARLP